MPVPTHKVFLSGTRTFRGWEPDPTLRGLMSRPGPNDTWPAKIHQYWETLSSFEQTILSSEDEYREALRQLCVNHKERNATVLSNRIFRQHSHILVIASALDTLRDHEAPCTLTALILTASRIAIQVGGMKTLHLTWELTDCQGRTESQVQIGRLRRTNATAGRKRTKSQSREPANAPRQERSSTTSSKPATILYGGLSYHFLTQCSSRYVFCFARSIAM